MKKSISINLGGRAFLITEDAYNSLEDYLSSLATTFKGHDSADEIVADIEARISELCEKRLAQSHGDTIDIDLVNEMINRMGKPEAMIDEDSEENTSEPSNNESNEKADTKKCGESIFENMQLNKKFYLDTENRIVGGVISGLAAYIKSDVTLLRIIALVAIIATGYIGIISYLVVWCISPVAGNTSEKLRMQGIEPTPENIADKITNEKPSNEKKNDTPLEKEKGNITRIALLVAAIAICIYVFSTTFFRIHIDGSTINGTIILSLILLIAFFVQKANIPSLLKTILLIAITFFALTSIFVMIMNIL